MKIFKIIKIMDTKYYLQQQQKLKITIINYKETNARWSLSASDENPNNIPLDIDLFALFAIDVI